MKGYTQSAFFLVLGVGLIPTCLLATEPPKPGLQDPVGAAALHCNAAYPLRLKNQVLTRKLRDRLEETGYGKLIKQKKLSVAVVDLTLQTRIHYAAINDDEMMYTASLPKIVILLAAAQAAKEGRIRWNLRTETRLAKMINQSSNTDASWAFDLVGIDYIGEVLRRPGYCFYGDQHGGLWVGKAFSKGGPVKREYLENLTHASTARQVARFYTMMDKGLLVGPIGNKRILRVMSPPRIVHKFVEGLADREAVVAARKSGTWRTFHSDSTLVSYPDGIRYVAVGLADHPKGSKIMVDLIRIVDDLVREGKHRAAAPTEPVRKDSANK